MKYMCPVCGYPDLEDKPINHEICPCCGSQFGYDDYLKTHAELRQEWLDGGAKWFLVGYEPYGWNAYIQLQNAGFIKVGNAPSTSSSQIAVELNIPDYSPKENNGIKLVVRGKWYLVGQPNQKMGLIG
jgi:hypothetical protein